MIKQHEQRVRVGVERFYTRREARGRQQCRVFDATGLLVGYVNQYAEDDFRVVFTRPEKLPIRVQDHHTFTSPIRVRDFLRRAAPAGKVEWHG